MRLSQREQIMLQKAAHDNPGVLANWLLDWVNRQQEVGVSGSFDISELPIQVDLDRIAPPSHPSVTPAPSTPPRSTKESREEAREKWRNILKEVGYSELPKYQRVAINKFSQARIDVVEETDRMPDTEACWMGDHDMEGWEGGDFYLWVVIGMWSSQKSIRKWGCKDCALIIAKTHPEAAVHEVY